MLDFRVLFTHLKARSVKTLGITRLIFKKGKKRSFTAIYCGR